MCTLLLTFCLTLSLTSCGGAFNSTTAIIYSQTSCDEQLNPNTLLEEVNAGNEPALRAFLRLKIATHSWCKPPESFNRQAIMEAARRDLLNHKNEIPTSYFNLFSSELTAQLKDRTHDSLAQSTAEPKVERRPEFEVALSLLGQANGVGKAVNIVQSDLAEGNDPGPIIVPFLRRLEKVNSAEVPKVLSAVVSAEEAHPGSISSDTLFTLKHLFISKQISQDLRQRYLAVVINKAGETEPSLSAAVNNYAILVDALPLLESQSPELYSTASARVTRLREYVPKRTLERMSLDKRISKSDDPLALLMLEKDSVSDPSLKEELQVEAARLALEKGKIRMAIELVTGLQPKSPGEQLWRDQFIEKAVGSAAERGEMEVAQYGINQIQSATVKLSTLENVALRLQASNNSTGAREALNSALGLVKAWDDSADKAGALLDLADTFMKVDSSRAPEVAHAAVVTINNTPTLLRKADVAGDARLVEVENVMKVAYRMVPIFQLLSKANKPAALALAEQIRRQELRTAARVSVYTGQPVVNKEGQMAASN